ncbi:MAG: hypothetical protein ACP5C3_02355 [Methanomicrobiales archaeon]
MNRTKFMAQVHDRLIRSVVKKLEKEGYSVQADHINHPNGKPKECRGHSPDVRAIRGLEEILIEVETCDTVLFNNEHKWRRFSFKPGTKFYVIVPCNCREKAEIKKRIMNLPVEIRCGDLQWGELEDFEF